MKTLFGSYSDEDDTWKSFMQHVNSRRQGGTADWFRLFACRIINRTVRETFSQVFPGQEGEPESSCSICYKQHESRDGVAYILGFQVVRRDDKHDFMDDGDLIIYHSLPEAPSHDGSDDRDFEGNKLKTGVRALIIALTILRHLHITRLLDSDPNPAMTKGLLLTSTAVMDLLPKEKRKVMRQQAEVICNAVDDDSHIIHSIDVLAFKYLMKECLSVRNVPHDMTTLKPLITATEGSLCSALPVAAPTRKQQRK